MLTPAEIDAIADALARRLQNSQPSPFAHRLDDMEAFKESQRQKARAVVAERRKQKPAR